jgi:hypothetical protein
MKKKLALALGAALVVQPAGAASAVAVDFEECVITSR